MWELIVAVAVFLACGIVYAFVRYSLRDRLWIKVMEIVIASVIVLNIVRFLPNSLAQGRWTESLGIVASCGLLLVWSIWQIVSIYNSSSAYISADGRIIKSRNFPWNVVKTAGSNENLAIYVIEERYGDCSQVTVRPDRRVNTEVYTAKDGLAIKFFCKAEEVPSFKVRIGP